MNLSSILLNVSSSSSASEIVKQYLSISSSLNLLARIGVVNSDYLKKTRRYVIVIIFTVAAILTPPDPITQIGLAIPLLLLYELSIITVKFTENKNKDKEVDNA